MWEIGKMAVKQQLCMFYYLKNVWLVLLVQPREKRAAPGPARNLRQYIPGMTGPPNLAVGPVTLTAILYPQPAVKIRYSRRLPKNSDTMKLKRICQVPMKTWPFSAGVNLWSFWTITSKNESICVRALRCPHIRVVDTLVSTVTRRGRH